MFSLILYYLLLLNSTLSLAQISPIDLSPPPWPRWAHEHWVWENYGHDESVRTLVDDYLKHDIPVGAVIIDRPWDTTPSTFQEDPKRYPKLAQTIEWMHDRSVKVLLWAVSILNQQAPNFEFAKSKNFFIKNGTIVKWWGGRGALLNYDNPEAVDWWHSQMDHVIAMGIDGWKLDASDPFVILANTDGSYAEAVFDILQPFGNLEDVWNSYKEKYYRDYFHYLRSQRENRNDTLIMARAVDRMPGIGFRYKFAPYDVNFAAWMGDQDGTWNGLQDALKNMEESANNGYLNFGTDIGGFNGGGKREKNLFIRWAQLGTFSTLMENGGNGEHRPWEYDKEVETIYRNTVYLHHSLIPYIYSSAALAFQKKESTYQTVISPRDFCEIECIDWQYLLGPSLFIAPIQKNSQKKMLYIPPGEWIFLYDTKKVVSEGFRQREFALAEYPVYIRNGSILPLEISNKEHPFASPLSNGATTIAIFPTTGFTQFPIFEQNSAGTILAYEKNKDTLKLYIKESADQVQKRRWLFRIQLKKVSEKIRLTWKKDSLENNILAEKNWSSMNQQKISWFLDENNILWINLPSSQPNQAGNPAINQELSIYIP